MSSFGQSTIAQLLFADERTIDFARIVGELEGVLSRLKGSEVRIAWDCDDLVIFDIPETRILLAWHEVGRRDLEVCLTVSVGPSPLSDRYGRFAEHDVLCSRLVERIQNRFHPTTSLWQQVEGQVSAELVDDLIDQLPDFGGALPRVEHIVAELLRRDALESQETRPASLPDTRVLLQGPKTGAMPALHMPAPSSGGPEIANDRPDLPRLHCEELAGLRAALYATDAPEVTPRYSTQMRLTAHCFNATLILVYAPLGAAVMTYSLLRGEDMRLSGRLMAVCGTLFAIAHTPVGQSVAAMATALT